MAMFRILVHAVPAGVPAPEAVLARLNGQLVGSLAPGRFVTACFAWLEPVSGQLVYSLAGHPPPWIVRGVAHRAERLVASGGPPLGLFGDARYESGQALLWPGDTLVFHTDGLTEAMAPSRELFGETRLEEALAATNGDDLATMRLGLLARLERHRAGAPLSDDLSLLLVRRLSGSTKVAAACADDTPVAMRATPGGPARTQSPPWTDAHAAGVVQGASSPR
jgi:sigma-B regulation protein RsbU (phosphoserine phosphatase)